jgi:TRAP-type C4-dicarboxylate transport system permease small subunit
LVAACAGISAIALGLMALWVTYDVVARYLLQAPTDWAGDLAEYALLWATFLGSPWLVRRNGHIMVELMVDRLSPSARDRVLRASWIIAALACGIFAYQAGLKTLFFYETGRVVSKSWEIPLFVPYLAMPIGMALMTIECLRMAVARTQVRQDLMLS